MKIGIIGAGHIGANAARLFINAGHEVLISNSREPDSLAKTLDSLGDECKAGTTTEAAAFGDVCMIAIPFGKYRSLPSDQFEGKIVIDANNYYLGRDGNFEAIDDGKTTSSEILAEFLDGSRVVKAFNTIWFEHLRTQGKPDAPIEDRRVIFVAGDDAEAKQVVLDLIEEIGFAPYDTGGLAEGGRKQQPDTLVYNKDLKPAEATAILENTNAESDAASSV
ncbi:MAG: NAD(P)-binding domain-containing protein [Acidobacteriota bacterium]